MITSYPKSNPNQFLREELTNRTEELKRNVNEVCDTLVDDLKSQDDKEYEKILLQDLDRSKEERKETNQKVAYIKELFGDIDYIKMSTESSKEPVTTIVEVALIFLSNMQRIINSL